MDSISKKSILITGATGYLAGRILQTLDSYGIYHLVLGCRNLKLASTLQCYIGKELREFDIGRPETFSRALEEIDIVIHLASMNFQDCQKEPELAQNINVEMVQELINQSIKSKVSQVVYMSTFHVYGANAAGVITEETSTNPISIYAKTHLDAEKIITSSKEIKGKIIRLSNAIGAPLVKDISAWKLLVNDLCYQAVTTKKLILLSTGDQKRDFFSVSCIGDAIHTLISSGEEHDNQSSIYNLGSEATISILDMAYIIQRSCQLNLGFTPELERKIDSNINSSTFPSFIYSTKKLQSLGFKVLVSLEEEVKNTLLTLA